MLATVYIDHVINSCTADIAMHLHGDGTPGLGEIQNARGMLTDKAGMLRKI